MKKKDAVGRNKNVGNIMGKEWNNIKEKGLRENPS